MTVFVYVGNTAPSVEQTIRSVGSDGLLYPVDLTTVTVRFRMRSLFGSALLIDAPAVKVNPPGADGEVRYDWSLADTTTAIGSSPGPYRAWWHLDYGGGTVLDTGEFDVDFLDHSTRRSVGPCTDWCSTQDVIECYPDLAETSACLTSGVRMASEVLYEMSGRQFPGWCQSVIRPCQDGGACASCLQFLDRGHVIWAGQSWCSVDGDLSEPCGCGGWLQKVTLPGIAQSIVEVLISGVVLSPSAYRLDPDNSLIRTDGGAWPICQSMAAAGDAVGAFQVTYSHGYQPPEVGRRAAVQLAHEFWLACAGQACDLPSGVVKIVRQGIEITRAANLFRDGATGLAMVDAFLAAYPQHPAVLVMSPEIMATDRRTA